MSIRSIRSGRAAAVLLPLALPAAQAAAPDADLAPVVVTATRVPTRSDRLLADVGVLDREEIEHAGQSTLEQLLARQPGIEHAANGGPGASSSIYLRGTESGHALVLIDGQRVGSATLGSLAWSRIPLSQIERIEILRGPASALYGSDAIGGVIQIFTRRGADGLRVSAEAGIGSDGARSLAGGLAGGGNGWRYSVTGGSLRTDGFSNIRNPANGGYNADRDGFRNESATANLSFAPARGHEIGLTLFHSDGTNKYDSGTTAASRAKDYENALTVQSQAIYLKSAVMESWSSTLRFGRTLDDSTNYSNGAATSTFRTDQDQIAWQNDVRLPLGSLLLGWEELEQKIGGTTNYTLKQRSIRSWLAGWAADLDAHRVQVNLHRDDNSQFGAHATGTLAYGYRIAPAWRVSASVGTAFRAPTFNDLYYPLNFGYVGNPDLLPESSRNRELALHHETRGQRVSATVYRNDVKNLISWSGRTSPVNVGAARIKGLTLAYAGHLGGYDVDGSLDLLDARDATTGRRLARRAGERLNLALGRTHGAWTWRGELQAVGARHDDNANTVRLGGYALVNLHASHALTPEWSVFGRVNNLFDKRYELVADFGTPGANLFVGLRYAPQ
ncbi:MAG: TonB-dependent receptor [Pseudomonadota bacterium]